MAHHLDSAMTLWRFPILALERFADPHALAVLGQIARHDVSARVRAYADRTAGRVLFRMGGGTGTLLTALNTVGCRHLAKDEFEKAHARFDEMLRIMPGNATALYNKACTYARAKDVDLACAYLKKAVINGFKDLEHIEGDSDLANIRAVLYSLDCTGGRVLRQGSREIPFAATLEA